MDNLFVPSCEHQTDFDTPAGFYNFSHNDRLPRYFVCRLVPRGTYDPVFSDPFIDLRSRILVSPWPLPWQVFFLTLRCTCTDGQLVLSFLPKNPVDKSISHPSEKMQVDYV